MRWDDKLRAFYYTATLGTAKEASNRLGNTGSAVTRSIKALEKEIGHKLFTVVKQRFFLTEKGKSFLEPVKNILFQYELSLQKLNDLSQNQARKENFTLSFPSFISGGNFYKNVSRFMDYHPSLALTIKPMEEAPNLHLGEICIDIRPLTKKEEFIEYHHLATYHIGLYASQEYLNKKGLLEKISDFKNHHLISFTEECLFPYASINWYLTHLPQCEQLTTIESASDMARAIESGMGIGPLPHITAQVSHAPLVPIFPEILTQSVDVYYMYPKSLSSNKAVTELYRHLRLTIEEPLPRRTLI